MLRPTILHDAVFPRADQILTSADFPPSGQLTFVVPVQIEDPSHTFPWEIFVDYDSDPNAPPALFRPGQINPTAGTVDGGTVMQSFDLGLADGHLSEPYCHRIEFVVAYAFSAVHTPDSIGGDSVTWLYNGAGGTTGCPQPFDASALGDTGVSMSDAPADHVVVVPESGSEP